LDRVAVNPIEEEASDRVTEGVADWPCFSPGSVGFCLILRQLFESLSFLFIVD
jgi:hypothetical protein